MAPPAEIAVGVILYGLDDPFVSEDTLGVGPPGFLGTD
ncbi:similar to An07g08970 [Aspergillus luchuensis]|uniref:Similar to An07g08970 n=1 Tax=Aspergillus kawachii TaxID=1069201 RepID=A0A146FTB0_ASPKA|nr:similar to An07g08970 [Aspergillus luchuensis]